MEVVGYRVKVRETKTRHYETVLCFRPPAVAQISKKLAAAKFQSSSATERRGVPVADHCGIGHDSDGGSNLNLVFTFIRVPLYGGCLACEGLEDCGVGDGPVNGFVVGDGGRVVAHLA